MSSSFFYIPAQRENDPQNPQKLARKLIIATMDTSPAILPKLAKIGLMHSDDGLSVYGLVA